MLFSLILFFLCNEGILSSSEGQEHIFFQWRARAYFLSVKGKSIFLSVKVNSIFLSVKVNSIFLSVKGKGIFSFSEGQGHIFFQWRARANFPSLELSDSKFLSWLSVICHKVVRISCLWAIKKLWVKPVARLPDSKIEQRQMNRPYLRKYRTEIFLEWLLVASIIPLYFIIIPRDSRERELTK